MDTGNLKKGRFYGVSVGPGDPELLTLKAVRCLERCPVLAAPQTASGRMLALDIARGAADLRGKTILPLHFVMSREEEALRASHQEAAEKVRACLDAGQDVAMLNLGDVSVYATYGYLEEILKEQDVPHCRGAQLLRRRGPAGLQPDRRDGAAADHRSGPPRRRSAGGPGHESADEDRPPAAPDAGSAGPARAFGKKCDGLQLRSAGRGRFPSTDGL